MSSIAKGIIVGLALCAGQVSAEEQIQQKHLRATEKNSASSRKLWMWAMDYDKNENADWQRARWRWKGNPSGVHTTPDLVCSSDMIKPKQQEVIEAVVKMTTTGKPDDVVRCTKIRSHLNNVLAHNSVAEHTAKAILSYEKRRQEAEPKDNPISKNIMNGLGTSTGLWEAGSDTLLPKKPWRRHLREWSKKGRSLWMWHQHYIPDEQGAAIGRFDGSIYGDKVGINDNCEVAEIVARENRLLEQLSTIFSVPVDGNQECLDELDVLLDIADPIENLEKTYKVNKGKIVVETKPANADYALEPIARGASAQFQKGRSDMPGGNVPGSPWRRLKQSEHKRRSLWMWKQTFEQANSENAEWMHSRSAGGMGVPNAGGNNQMPDLPCNKKIVKAAQDKIKATIGYYQSLEKPDDPLRCSKMWQGYRNTVKVIQPFAKLTKYAHDMRKQAFKFHQNTNAALDDVMNGVGDGSQGEGAVPYGRDDLNLGEHTGDLPVGGGNYGGNQKTGTQPMGTFTKKAQRHLKAIHEWEHTGRKLWMWSMDFVNSERGDWEKTEGGVSQYNDNQHARFYKFATQGDEIIGDDDYSGQNCGGIDKVEKELNGELALISSGRDAGRYECADKMQTLLKVANYLEDLVKILEETAPNFREWQNGGKAASNTMAAAADGVGTDHRKESGTDPTINSLFVPHE